MPRGLRLWLVLAVLACLVALAMQAAAQLSAFHVQDDAYMFARYAENLLDHGRLAWDPAGAPTYGMTSLLYVAVVAPFLALFRGEPALAISLSSLVCGLAALLAILVLVWRAADAEGDARLWYTLYFLIPLAAAGEHVSAHLADGMDTGLAMLVAAVLLHAWTAHERRPTRATTLFTGVWGGVCYLARPDLALFALVVPGVVALLRPGPDRRRALAICALSVGLIAAQIVVAAAYFGAPFPLSFYVKSLNHTYGPEFRASYAQEPLRHGLDFLKSYWPFFAVAAVAFVFDLRRRLREQALFAGVLAATALYLGYYFFGVVQVVAFHQRFYYPTLPAIAWLGARGLSELWRSLPAMFRESTRQITLPAQALFALCLVPLLASPLMAGARSIRRERSGGRMGEFDLAERYRRHSSRFWIGLQRFSVLPDDLVIATTEVGHPAALNPRKKIVDLAGLNETGFALHGFSAERLFGELRPDVLYMPHPDYKAMDLAIRRDPRFTAEYEVFEAKAIGAYMGVALWRKSAHYERLRTLLEEELADTRTAQNSREFPPSVESR